MYGCQSAKLFPICFLWNNKYIERRPRHLFSLMISAVLQIAVSCQGPIVFFFCVMPRGFSEFQRILRCLEVGSGFGSNGDTSEKYTACAPLLISNTPGTSPPDLVESSCLENPI